MEEIRRWSHIYENGAPRFIEHYNSTTHKATTFVPERTCREVLVDKHWRGCSECGYKWEFMYGIGKCERPNYCPNCGAMITEEDE